MPAVIGKANGQEPANIIMVTGDLLYAPRLADGREIRMSENRLRARDYYLELLQEDALDTFEENPR